MRPLAGFGAMGMLLLSFLQLPAQQRPAIVNLTVIHNGRPRPAPNEIELSFGDHSVQIPVREGKFEVPPEFVTARRVTFQTDVEGDHIRISELPDKVFLQENWTLRLAERANDEYYEWPGPKGVNIRATCMLEFDSVHTDPGRVHFEQHCRSKKK